MGSKLVIFKIQAPNKAKYTQKCPSFFAKKNLLPLEIVKVGVVTIDVLSIGIKFENFKQAGCRDLGLQPCTAESPLFCPNWYSFLEHF